MTSIDFPLTIWYSENPPFDVYRREYERRLYDFARKHIDPLISVSPPTTEFLLQGDIASNLVSLEMNAWKEITTDSQVFLSSEWEIFRSSGIDMIRSRQWEKIEGTDILLTKDVYTPGNLSRISHPSMTHGENYQWFSDISVADWLKLYGQVFDMLRLINPWFSSEINQVLQKIIPIGTSFNCHNSGSLSDAIGHIYMSYPLGPHIDNPVIAVLEAVIHEYNHNKLHIIWFSNPLVLSNRDEKYYSPYRPDARHISWVYAWLHAIAWVLYVLFSGLRDEKIPYNQGLVMKSLLYFMKNQTSIHVLKKYGRFSPIWETLLNEMIEVHKSTLSIIKAIGYPREYMEQAAIECKQHFIEAQKNNQILLY